MGFLTEDMIESAKLRSFAPISQNTFEESEIITIGNDELLLKLVSDIFSAREDFFLTSKSVSIRSNIDHYPVPKRAIGGALKALFFVDSSGSRRELVLVDVTRSKEYPAIGGDPQKFYFEGDEVVILPKPGVSRGSLLFSFFAKPNTLVATSTCAKITGISSSMGSTIFDVDTDLTASLVIGSKVDLLSAESPFLLWNDRVSLTAISSTQIQVATADVEDAGGIVEAQVGDYICPTGTANIPMIPEEFHPVLHQMIAVRLLAGLGDSSKWNMAKIELKELRGEALKLIKNRVETSPPRISGRNGLLKAFSS